MGGNALPNPQKIKRRGLETQEPCKSQHKKEKPSPQENGEGHPRRAVLREGGWARHVKSSPRR